MDSGIPERLHGIMLKEFRQMRRDKLSMGMLVFIPALMLVMYGYALTFDVKHIKIVVLDHDRSAASREFTAGMFHSEYFRLVGTIEREAEAGQWLDAGQARAVIVIPPRFGQDLEQRRGTDVQVLVDGSNSNSANITLGYITAKAREYSIKRVSTMLQARGVRQPAVPIIVEPRVWYNPELESSHFLVPGLIGYLLMLAATVATSLSVVREKERGTLEQIVVSPVRPAEFILGKTLPYLFVSIVTSALIIGAAMLLFGMPLRGNVGWLFVSVIVFLLGSLGIGLWVSTIADTQQVALQISLLITLLPAMLLSGMIFPIASMPKALRWITLVVPPRHFIVIMRSIILKGTGPEAWANELAILAVFAVAILTIASVRMRKRSAA